MMKKLAFLVLVVMIFSAPCMVLDTKAASAPADGFYTEKQLQEQFSTGIGNLISNYTFDALKITFSPVEVYITTNSSGNTKEIETSQLEMNLNDIVLESGQEQTFHLVGTDTVSEGGRWEGQYTIRRDFEADITLSVHSGEGRPGQEYFSLAANNVLFKNFMNRLHTEPLVIKGEEMTMTFDTSGSSSFAAMPSTDPYPSGVNLTLNPESSMHKNSAYAAFKIYIVAVKPNAKTLALLKTNGGDGLSTTEDSDAITNNPDAADKPVDQVINTQAEKTAGENGFSVVSAVVLGVVAAAAAAGAVGTAGAAAGTNGGAPSGSSGDEPSGEWEGPSYQMIIGKDFGNSLKIGQKQRVWARMVELKNGAPVDRPDLTAGISIFSREVLVGASSLRDGNVEAEVQIQENAPQEGVISFLYSGEHGMYQNNVHFRLLGKGEIRLATDKVNILSTDARAFELVYELINFAEEEPPLEITASSGLVALDIGKNDKQQTVIRIFPGPDADPWDRTSFTKVCRCKMTAMDGKLPIQADFEVAVCFEGIGTAYAKLPINETPDDALIECFTDTEKEKREEKALWIPLTVMKWDEKRRILQPDTAKTDALKITFEIHPEFEFKTLESKVLAERVISKAKIKTQLLPVPTTLSVDNMKRPSAYRLLASADPDEGASPFDIRMAVSCETDQKLEPLMLRAQIKPNPDLKGMVRWFLEYPLGTAAADFITLGSVATYHRALDFIESRVYAMSGVPWSASLLWNKVDDSFYEDGRGDIMRKSYIAIVDQRFPKSADTGDFKKVQTLVHELTHVIEDQHGDYNISAKSESHAYFLQHLSDMAMHLTDMEKSGGSPMVSVRYAINYGYWLNVEPLIIGDLGNIGPWFGGEMKLGVHELFDKYAYHIETLGGKMDEAQRQAVAQEFRHWYFPGNLSMVTVQRGGPTDAIGRFTDTSGPFKDTEWKFSWNQGVLESVEAEHSDYIFEVRTYRWTGGNELKLQVELRVSDKNAPSYNYDYLTVTLDGGTFNMQARSFPSVRSFDVKWHSINDHQHSLLFKKLGFSEATSWMERKK